MKSLGTRPPVTTFVVLWRAGDGAPWEVQPRLYSEVVAERVGTRLMEMYQGEAVMAPIDVESAT